MIGFEFLVLFFLIDPVIIKPQDSPLDRYVEKKCPKTVIINVSKEPWEDIDEETLQISKKRCGQLYINSPCLKRFMKKKNRAYNAICGAKQ